MKMGKTSKNHTPTALPESSIQKATSAVAIPKARKNKPQPAIFTGWYLTGKTTPSPLPTGSTPGKRLPAICSAEFVRYIDGRERRACRFTATITRRQPPCTHSGLNWINGWSAGRARSRTGPLPVRRSLFSRSREQNFCRTMFRPAMIRPAGNGKFVRRSGSWAILSCYGLRLRPPWPCWPTLLRMASFVWSCVPEGLKALAGFSAPCDQNQM